MSKLLKRMFASISKTETQDDGTLKVWGYASANCIDSDGETITTDAMKAALPDYMKFGAVREMHQPMAAGTAIEASIEEDTGKTFFGAHIVDPVAVLKVQTGVYKGFSIGGKVTERDTADKKIIKGLKLVEISLVDRPANPEATFTMYKSEKDDTERTPEDDITDLAAILDKGEVSPAQVLEYIAAAQKAAAIEAPAEAPVPTPAAVPEAVLPVAEAEVLRGKAEGTELKKSMYSVSRFAELLTSLGSLSEDATWEAQYEGDSSPIPAALVAWLKSGLTIFMDMATEEAQELVATLSAAANLPDVLTQADKVAKAGAKYSTATKSVLADIHKMLTEGCSKMEGLGYKTADDDVESSAGIELGKADSDTVGIVLSTPVVDEAIAKAVAPLNESLEKLGKENAELKEQVAKMGKMPAPGKALLKAVSISKSTDSAVEAVPADTAEAPAEGTQERASYEMRKVFSNGGRRLL
jgi:hypothetical protein